MMIRRDAWREYSRGSLWLLPVVAVVVSVGLGAVLSQIDVGPGSPLAFQGTADDARNLLIAITSTMVTVIALLLGLAVVALQLSSTQFSPRLLRNFLRDRPNQIVLSVFVGTFGYSAGGLFQVGVSGGERVAEFPRFAVTVAVALLFLSLGLLVFFADHLAHSIQVDQVMRVAEKNTLKVISELPPVGESVPVPPPGAHVVPARVSGYVQFAHGGPLSELAAAHRVHIRVRPRVGEHVVAGSTLAWVWPVEQDLPGIGDHAWRAVDAAVTGAVRIGFERTLEQDPGLGMRQLCDAACKALSPAINDPYTAIQAIEHLSVIFAALAVRPSGNVVVYAQGCLVAVSSRSFSEHLAGGVGLIRRYGAAEPTVIAALLRLLATALEAIGQVPQHWEVVQEQANLLVSAAEREVAEPADLAIVHSGRAALEDALDARRAALRD
jgi:uncharacterized membrane protein